MVSVPSTQGLRVDFGCHGEPAHQHVLSNRSSDVAQLLIAYGRKHENRSCSLKPFHTISRQRLPKYNTHAKLQAIDATGYPDPASVKVRHRDRQWNQAKKALWNVQDDVKQGRTCEQVNEADEPGPDTRRPNQR